MGKYYKDGVIRIPSSYSYGTQDDILEEIASVVNCGKREDGRFHVADVCIALGINKWSKHKPVRSTDKVHTSTTHIADGWYGFDITAATVSNQRGDTTTIPSKMTDDKSNGWEYAKPRGSNVNPKERFRIRDFADYYHKAEPFVKKFSMPLRVEKGDSINISCMSPETPDLLSVSHLELPIKDYYFGAAFGDEESASTRATSKTKISEGGFSATLDISRLPQGTYKVYPFVSSGVLSFDDGDVMPYRVLTIPNLTAVDFEIVESYIIVHVSGTFNIMGTLSYTITIENIGPSSRPINTNYLRVQHKSSGWYDPIIQDGHEYETKLEDFTLAASEKKTITGVITTIADASDLVIRASFGSMMYTDEGNIMRPETPK